MIARALILAAAGGAWVAQDWRSLESSRQRTDDAPLSVRMDYAAGTLDVRPTNDRVLYRLRLKYDAEHAVPLTTYDAAAHRLSIGTRTSGSTTWKHKGDEAGTMSAELPRGVPMRLTLQLGAAEGSIQLGGLRLTDLSLKTGATDIRVDVAEPNAEAPGLVSMDVGAAKLVVARAGNLRARHTELNVGVGSLDYDLSGDWSGDAVLNIDLALGHVTLRVPDDVGVRVEASTFLVDLGKAGLRKRGDAWESGNFESSRRHAIVKLDAAFGGFEIVRR